MNPFKKILMIDNYDSFTFNIVDYLEQQGAHVRVYRNDQSADIIEQVSPELIVISPGPSVPKNAGNLMQMIERSVGRYPIFGVCLGLEALVEFFGGSLRFVTPVHGKSSPIHHDGNTIFSELDQDFLGGRYHSLVTDRLPDCFEISASTKGMGSEGDLIMGIRHKTLPIEAVQFHPESVLTMKRGNGMKMIENVIRKKFAHV